MEVREDKKKKGSSYSTMGSVRCKYVPTNTQNDRSMGSWQERPPTCHSTPIPYSDQWSKSKVDNFLKEQTRPAHWKQRLSNPERMINKLLFMLYFISTGWKFVPGTTSCSEEGAGRSIHLTCMSLEVGGNLLKHKKRPQLTLMWLKPRTILLWGENSGTEPVCRYQNTNLQASLG